MQINNFNNNGSGIHYHQRIDDTKQQYLNINAEDLAMCIETTKFHRICRQSNPILFTHNHNNCEIALFNKNDDKIPDNCDKRLIEVEESIFIQLTNKNAWLFLIPKQEP